MESIEAELVGHILPNELFSMFGRNFITNIVIERAEVINIGDNVYSEDKLRKLWNFLGGAFK